MKPMIYVALVILITVLIAIQFARRKINQFEYLESQRTAALLKQ